MNDEEKTVFINHFDAHFYRSHYIDLQHLTLEKCKEHFINLGINEGRYGSLKQKQQILNSPVDIEFYRKYYEDLKSLTDQQLRDHWVLHGKQEGRIPFPPFETPRKSSNNVTTNERSLVIYVFHVVNNRVIAFVKNAIFKNPHVDFLMVCNDITFDFKSLHLPQHVKTITRENKGFDFAAYSYGLLHDNLYKQYDKFILMNSSCVGPFLPSYYKGVWTDIFLNGLKEDVKLFGTIINTNGMPKKRAHVQSNLFCLDKEAIEYLIEFEIFSMTKMYNSLQECVLYQEILMSRLIIDKGWNIGCLFEAYHGVDFTFKKVPFENLSKTQQSLMAKGDLMYPQYRYTLWNPLQLVFYKGNRF